MFHELVSNKRNVKKVKSGDLMTHSDQRKNTQSAQQNSCTPFPSPSPSPSSFKVNKDMEAIAKMMEDHIFMISSDPVKTSHAAAYRNILEQRLQDALDDMTIYISRRKVD
jgi:hypothetical protein